MLLPNVGFALSSNNMDKLDIFVSKLSHERMTHIQKNIQKLENSNRYVSKRNREILDYIETSINTRLGNADTVKKAEMQQVEDEVMLVQNAISNTLRGNVEALLWEFSRLSHVEETGDLSMTIDINTPDATAEGSLELKDYSAISAGLDSRLKTNISAFMSTTSDGQTLQFNMSSFLDYITKDNNMYILLEDLEISASELLYLDGMIDTLKKISEEKNYIAIEDYSNEQILAMLQSFSPEAILWELDTFFEKPLLRAYAKRGDKYILVPTKYACDQGKILTRKFNYFYVPGKCSDAQYHSILEGFTGEHDYVYMTLGRNTTLGISSKRPGSDESLEWHVIFDKNKILSSVLNYTDTNEKLVFEYKYASHISLNISDDSDDFVFDANVDLNYSNAFKWAMLNMSVLDGDALVKMNMDMRNGNISGMLDVMEEDEQVFESKLTWTYARSRFDAQFNFEFFENPFESSIEIKYVDEEIDGAECYDSYYDDYKYVCYVDKEPSWDTLTWDISIKSDNRYGRINLDAFAEIFLADEQIIEFELKNRGTRTYKKTQIQKPENVTPLEDLFPSSSESVLPPEDAVEAIEY